MYYGYFLVFQGGKPFSVKVMMLCEMIPDPQLSNNQHEILLG